ncbi:two-component regulator propeller domain-containing protein [Niabella terrae]
MFRLTLLIALNILAVVTYGQPLYFRHYQVEDGLSTNTVISALQDNFGFLWLGTSEGLNRFDGNQFKIYRHQPGNSKSLRSNAVFCLFQDQKNQLWVGTEKGIFRYNSRTDDFDAPIPVPFNTVRSICDDEYGQLWFLLDNKLFCYNFKQNKITQKYIPGVRECSVLYRDSAKQGIWIGTTDGKVIHLKNNHANVYIIPGRSSNSIEALSKYKEDYLLIGSSKQGLVSLDIRGKTYRHLIHDSHGGNNVFVRNILPVNDSNIYVSTENGLYIYNWQTQSYRLFQKSRINPFSLSDNALYALCQDSEGGIWIGSFFGGINYLPHTPIQFEKFLPGPDPNSLSGNAIREIIPDISGKLWIGSEDGGLSLYDPSNNRFEKYTPNTTNRLSSSNIHGMLALGNYLLIGTFENGLDIMDLRFRKVIRNYPTGKGAFDLKINFINKIIRSSSGDILMCTAQGLYRFDLKNGRFYLISRLPTHHFYSAIAEDSSGTIWVGTHNSGIYYMNRQDTGRLILKNDLENRIQNTRILYLMPDTDHHLWVCTIDGLFNVDLDARTFLFYRDQPDGLPGNIIYSIIKDDQGNYWIPGSRGLAFMEAKTKKIKIFRKNNGLLNDQFNYHSVYKDPEGRLYMGSIKGLIRFDPDRMDTSDYTPPVYLTQLQYPDATPGPDPDDKISIPLLAREDISLRHDQASFNIDFTAINFTDPSGISFAYQINNGDWFPLGNARQIAFNNQPPGVYNIKIRSTNAAGEWMNNEKMLTVEIDPPIWKSSLAYLLYTLLILITGLLVLRYLSNRQREKQRYKMELFALGKEKELYGAKMDFFTGIAHEIKTPLTLIKLPLEHLTKSLADKPDLRKYLQIMNNNTARLLELTHQLLDFRKAETEQYQLFLVPVDLVKTIKESILFFQPAITRKNIQLHQELPGKPLIVAADQEALIKIINNLIDNAVKYCRQEISISVARDRSGKIAVLTITNDGPIVPDHLQQQLFEPFFRYARQDVPGTGLGLSLASTLTELHKGKLRYKTEDGKNLFITTFELKPTGSDNYANPE